MKCVKEIFRDILPYALYVDFCHTKFRSQEEKNILGTSFRKSKTTHVAKKSNLRERERERERGLFSSSDAIINNSLLTINAICWHKLSYKNICRR